MKNKIMDVIWVLGLGFCVGFCLLQIELIGWHTLVSLEYNWLYVQPTVQLRYQHQESVANFIRWNFGPQAKLATAIFQAESGLRCDRVSATGDYGIAQINLKAHPQYSVGQLLDCKTNIQIAAKIYKQQGNFSAWSTFKNKQYLKFLN